MKKLKKLLGACFALVAFAAATTPALAQTPINWPAGTYSPNSLAEMGNNRWSSYALPNSTTLYANIWYPWNAAGSRVDSSNWRMPMRHWVRIFDTTKRHWHVEYDLVGEIPAGSPYRNTTSGYSWVKSYPHIQYKPPVTDPVYVWQGDIKAFRSEWNLGAVSTDWANNRFNAIYEIRLGRYNDDGTRILNGDYIIQLEIMQARYGTPAPASVSLSGYNWTPGGFETYPPTKTEAKTPVHKFILSGAGVNQDTSRTVSIDLFAFMQYTANRPGTFPRASWNARVQQVNAGVEVCMGTNSRVWTGSYWVGAWNR
jgi:hypothetical protein